MRRYKTEPPVAKHWRWGCQDDCNRCYGLKAAICAAMRRGATFRPSQTVGTTRPSGR